MSNCNTNVEVIIENLNNHPCCPHGPTLLFSRPWKEERRRFFACAACRDRKHCNFFLWEDEMNKFKDDVWEKESKKYIGNINHRKKFMILNEICQVSSERRMYCLECFQLYTIDSNSKHQKHTSLKTISDYQLEHPSELLPPLDDAKKEAQFLFSKTTVEFIVTCVIKLGYKNVICIGAPRIHEYIKSKCNHLNSILLDFDRRFHDFFGPLEYCWYNMFNHHFFLNDAENVFNDFLRFNKDTILITDPPFGGRVEPIAFTIERINNKYKKMHTSKNDLPVFWIFPYFMEPQILNSFANFKMLDYKVDYENHPLFRDGPKGRKNGSPVRIFTNISRLIKLPSDGYKYCKKCDRWVANENNHCNMCNSCTSKNGVTYIHCSLCKRCVKPTWRHCTKCNRCALAEHTCEELVFTKDCYHCKLPGHKKSECPQVFGNHAFKRKVARTDTKINVNKKLRRNK